MSIPEKLKDAADDDIWYKSAYEKAHLYFKNQIPADVEIPEDVKNDMAGTSKNSFCRIARSFAPTIQIEKLEIHPIFLRFSYFYLCQNLRASVQK